MESLRDYRIKLCRHIWPDGAYTQWGSIQHPTQKQRHAMEFMERMKQAELKGFEIRLTAAGVRAMGL